MPASAITRILVVDDNDANRELARGTLEDEGYEVVLAASGTQALEVFEGGGIDCLLLDVRMPGLDGIAVCEQIRAMPEGERVPILFFTALRDIDTFDRAIQAGGNDFLTKPVRPTELVVRVKTVLELRRLGSELRDQYAVLKRQRDDLMRLQLQKERLMAFVVHDLKNPVHAIDLHAQLLLREKNLSQITRESAAEIRTSTRLLNRMILNLLDIAKADEGRLAPKHASIDLNELVAEVFGELGIEAEAHKAKLQTALECDRLHADPDLLRRALANLVENALRHAPPGTAVTVSSTRRRGSVELRVADRGKGVPLDMRERIFDPFVQLEAPTSTATLAGRGLGLAFCKAAVVAHGGRIVVEDGSPGAVFFIQLPEAP